MPNYRYKAIDNTGKLVRGTVTAFDDEDIENRIAEKDITLIKYSAMRELKGFTLFGSSKVAPRILIEFYYRFSQTLSLGLPILDALEENAKTLPSKPLRKIASELRVAIEAGKTLSEAMSGFPKIFQKLDLAIINLGEQTGVLPESMQNLATFLEWKEDIVSTIKRAMIYPAIVILVIILVIGVWVGYVLPQMSGMLVEMGVALPAITRTVLDISEFLKTNWLWMLCVFFALIISFFIIQKTKKGGLLFHKYLLKVPVVGPIASNIAVARLSHNFATMHGSGMTVNSIFEILGDNVIGNRYLEERLSVVHQSVLAGKSIAQGFEIAGGFPALLLGAIRNGEQTGTIEEAFKRLGDYFDKEVKRSVETMISAIEPLTIILLGGVFAIVALSVMLPLYDVIGDFGNAY